MSQRSRWLAVRRSAGRPDQTILILRDITSQKEIERQRESSRNMLALGEMSAVLAHEVRNPLSSMELWTGLLAKQPDNDEETKYWIENLQAGVRTLSATVNNVLQFHGRGTGNQIRLKLATVLQNGFAFISPLAEQAGIKLTLNHGPKEIEISGDPNGLQQVILNFAINAFRHTAIGGSVAISVRLKEDLSGVVLEFTDTGKGISEANLRASVRSWIQRQWPDSRLGFGGLQAHRRTTSGNHRRRKSTGQRHQVHSGVPHPMNQAYKSVLVVDDEPGIRMALKTNFQNAGWNVETASGATEAIRKYGQTKFPLVVTDVRMPDGNGLEVMRSVRASGTSTAVILLTAFGTVSEAVQAMQGGACDYLVKPFSFDQLQSAVERVMQHTDAPTSKTSKTEIVGNSLALVHALDRARLAAQTDADVLVEAESGTGKELLARFIHETSNRREKPLVAINCAAVPEQLLESELFGHVRGAFTGANLTKAGKFELANGGTLLLDEIGEMPLELQPKLLRVLQEREVERLGDTRTVPVNIRVIATTNVSLQAMVEQGRFRADLYYRLNVIPLTLPSSARAPGRHSAYWPTTSPQNSPDKLDVLHQNFIPNS